MPDSTAAARADDRWLFAGALCVVVGVVGGLFCTVASLVDAFGSVAYVDAAERAEVLSNAIARSMTIGLVGGGGLTTLGVVLLGYWVRRAWAAKHTRPGWKDEPPPG